MDTYNAIHDKIINWNSIDDSVWESHLSLAAEHARHGTFWSDKYRHKSIALLFMNPSLRTRCSMELAAKQLGAHPTTLEPGKDAWKMCFDDGVIMDGPEAEHVREAAGVLSSYFDTIGIRVFASMTDYDADRSDHMIHSFANAASSSVINMESAWAHPCQALADAATIQNHFGGSVAGRKFVLTWAYHPRALPMAVPNSTVLMATRMGMEVVVARPDGYGLDPGIMEAARANAAASSGHITETDSIEDAMHQADIVYAKAWGGPMAYADPDEETRSRHANKHWCVSSEWMRNTADAAFMHCLPVRRNVVVTDAVIDSPNALHLTQAANRLHAQKAILEHLWNTI